jgi:thioredoxin 1
MNKLAKVAVLSALLVVVGITMAVKQKNRDAPEPAQTTESKVQDGVHTRPAGTGADTAQKAEGKLPRLVDLGADKCIPCKMMAPILAGMKKEYAGRLQVDFIDIWKNRNASQQYKINLIPTQIFYDASGKERFRHEGFFSKEDILAKWEELGVNLTTKPAEASGPESTSK